MDNNTKQPVAWMALNRDGFPEKCLPSDPEGFPVYRSPPAPVAAALPLYTCIGKGGEYERLGYAKPSGALRTIQGESGIIVYRDIETGQLYFRDPADFQQRMTCLDKVKELNQ